MLDSKGYVGTRHTNSFSTSLLMFSLFSSYDFNLSPLDKQDYLTVETIIQVSICHK